MFGFDADDRPKPSDNDPDERARRSPVAYAKNRVRAPAVLMFVFAVLSLAMVPLNVLSYFTLPETLKTEREYVDRDPNLSDDQKRGVKKSLDVFETLAAFVVPLHIAFYLACGVVSVIGSLKMFKMRSHRWAMIASVVNIASIGHGCCFLTLPVGVWGLVVLMNDHVKAGYVAAREQQQESERN